MMANGAGTGFGRAAAATAGAAARGAAGEAAPWIERLARVGYAAKAVLYATVGLLAAQAAFGRGGGTTGPRGALATLLDAPFGRALLALVALGLVGYAAWRLVDAALDPERRGHEPKALVRRAGLALSGVIHAGLAVTAARLARGGSSGSSGGGTTTQTSAGAVGSDAGLGAAGSTGAADGGATQSLTARLLDAPGGRALLLAIAAGIVAFGVYQLVRAFRADLGRHLSLAELPPETARWARTVSRAGIAARGVVFTLVGLLLGRGVLAGRGEAAAAGADTGGALALLAGFGRWPLALVALGLVAYAAYQLLNARYRRIRAA